MSALGQKCKCYTDFDFLGMRPYNSIPCDSVRGNALHMMACHSQGKYYVTNQLFWLRYKPVSFLKLLKKKPEEVIYIDVSPPKWWYRQSSIELLKPYLSDTSRASSVERGAIWISPKFHNKCLSTVSEQAEFLILGIAQKRYPPSPSSCDYFHAKE